jgi:septum formation topological specificity factor MinE
MAEPVSTAPEPFAIKDCALIAIATGQKARSLRELRDRLRVISPNSLYDHFWGSLLEPRFEEREYNNSFATWARRGLHDDILAERLAMVDPSACDSLEALRQDILEVIEQRLEESEYLQWMLASEAFEFMESQIVVFDTHLRIEQPQQLAEILPKLSTSSIFYHFIDARRRLPERIDDFRLWLAGFNDRYQALADQIADIDPYFSSLTELRQTLANAFHRCCTEVTP